MYPPSRYAPVPNDDDSPSPSNPTSTSSAWPQSSTLRRPPICALRIYCLVLRTPHLVVLFLSFIGLLTVYHLYWGPAPIEFIYNLEPRPSWLDTPLPAGHEPLILRLAIITHIKESDRRKAIRDNVLSGLDITSASPSRSNSSYSRPFSSNSSSEIQIEYRFFAGRAPPAGFFSWGKSPNERILEENRRFGDITVLDVDDVPERVSEKRYGALIWGGSAPTGSYDYFMTMDSDTFCRFPVLARRLQHLYGQKNIKPREQPVLIGRMSTQMIYYQSTHSEKEGWEDRADRHGRGVDEMFRGPWYQYPVGIGYMMSSSLITSLLSATPPLPHHIPYPMDDVMVGSWVAGLQHLPDRSTDWLAQYDSSSPPHIVHPKPYIPHAVETTIIDDYHGWHDWPLRRGRWYASQIGWGSVCVHHASPGKMKTLRGRKEIREEWK
ncbi:hypothetical protein BDQ12DRAFT_693758 [Crucibulum laeve]|uniref:Hexosyltransferase n=1 Tax=Crucibulum laeve TaxID=68775 RepID=A0A5C3LGC6_9AGAR|nr:hypothetical protein BDQ12DRAFT_693758 [Crucibulum laeve]